MTNTSDKSPAPPPKPVKKKGPIRTGAVVPTLIFVALLFTYFHFFFDSNVRQGLQYALSQVNGAEVNIAAVKTSFLRATLEIDRIEVTDKQQPARNLVQVGSIRFGMLWDALLRLKIVVDEASILDIEALVPRRHPGFVIPPTPPSGKPSQLQKVEEAALEQTRKQYNGNFLGDLAGLLAGGDPKEKLKALEGNLKSDAKIKELQQDIAIKKTKWDDRIKQLPQAKELNVYQERIKALKFDFKNPGELAKNVQEAQKILAEAQAKVKLIDDTQKDLRADVDNYSKQYKELEKLVAEDLHDLQGKLKIPKIDAKEFSQQLFITMIEKKLGSLAKYVELARHYLPTKKTAEAKKEATADPIIPPKRSQGKTFQFRITTGYPLFWLKHAAISSKANDGEYSGNMKGELKDISTDPALLGRPALILLHGDFPKQGITDFDTRITLDHTTDKPKETMVMKVDGFPVKNQILSGSPDVHLALKEAKGQSEIHAVFEDAELTVNLKSTFSQIQYDLQAKNQVVQQLVDAVLKGIPQVNVNADITGSLHNLEIHINSNLGDELSKGFQKQLQLKIDQAQADLKKLIDDKIGGDKGALKGQMDQLGSLTKLTDGKKNDADKILSSTQKQMNSSNSKGNPQKMLEEEGQKLLKGFKFGG